ncbi:hypothetical protein JIN84_06710 [Luteolibacter yonseiensis]|uniref:Uncharacterized protein n=1 Tax=Luteolibacter yonseiensis TaxID=1144680 RepID=A0A934R2W3_9BACT|nr:hypothetical protein [Luteolibacter yonseiensis]MBK1815296.1 hypothetical protein [Luteolibacter yonseiensis]
MQLTRFDRWLREKYVYETHVQTLRPVEAVPRGIREVEIPDVPGKRFKHLYVASNAKAADDLISQLKENSQMYATQIVDRRRWYVPLIAPKEKSVTWFLLSSIIIGSSLVVFLFHLKGLVEDPEFRKNVMEALKLLRK